MRRPEERGVSAEARFSRPPVCPMQNESGYRSQFGLPQQNGPVSVLVHDGGISPIRVPHLQKMGLSTTSDLLGGHGTLRSVLGRWDRLVVTKDRHLDMSLFDENRAPSIRLAAAGGWPRGLMADLRGRVPTRHRPSARRPGRRHIRAAAPPLRSRPLAHRDDRPAGRRTVASARLRGSARAPCQHHRSPHLRPRTPAVPSGDRAIDGLRGLLGNDARTSLYPYPTGRPSP